MRSDKPSLQKSKEPPTYRMKTADRAMTLAHKLSMELRAAEDRINQLEAEVYLPADASSFAAAGS
jgi:hypothetical protein